MSIFDRKRPGGAEFLEKVKLAVFFTLTACLFLIAVFGLTACDGNVTAEDLVKCEAESAVVTPVLSNGSYVTPANGRSEYRTSNNKFVSKLKAGASVTWVFFAESDGMTDLYLSVANATSEGDSFTIGNGEGCTLSVNGREKAMPSVVIASASAYCDAWQLIRIGDVAVAEGYNTVVLTIADTANGAFNVDYLGVDPDGIGVSAHNHMTVDMTTKTVAATCTEEGAIYKSCPDCGLEYLFGRHAALGHHMSYGRYDAAAGNVVRRCERCDYTEARPCGAAYIGETYDDLAEAEKELRGVRTVYEAEDADIHTPAGLNNGTKPVEIHESASAGELIANISKLGNYVDFKIVSSVSCVSDLVLRLANTLYLPSGIGKIEDFSDYMSMTVGGEKIELSFAELAGCDTYDYYAWQYIVIKNVRLREGANILRMTPLNCRAGDGTNSVAVSMPNVDVLYIYTDEPCIAPVKTYDIYGAAVDNDYLPTSKRENAFTPAGNAWTLMADTVYDGDILIEVASEKTVAAAEINLTLLYNAQSVDVTELALEKGSNLIVLRGQKIAAGENRMIAIAGNGLRVVRVAAYTDEVIGVPVRAKVDDVFDAMTNQGVRVPFLSLEAEEADLGSSVATQNTLIASNPADSGGKHVENMARQGNSIEWTFDLDAAKAVDIAIRMACTNYDSLVDGNTTMTDLSRFVTITVDGLVTDLSAVNLECRAPDDWVNWKAVVFENFHLNAGRHSVLMTFKEFNFPNVDVLYVYEAESAAAEL